MVIRFGIKALRETFCGLAMLLVDFVKNFSFFGLKNFLFEKKEQMKYEGPLLLNKLKNLFFTNLDLGLYHFYKGNLSDALLRFNMLKLMRKNSPISWYYLGRCALLQNNYEKSLLMFNTALKLDSDCKFSNFYLGVISGVIKTSVPIDVIREEFEYKAHYYIEDYLIKKEYVCHKIVFDELIAFFGRQIVGIDVLDLGCGTGILGHFFKMCSVTKKIDGVDISHNMIKIAASCKVDGKLAYSNLINDDYVTFITESSAKYDAVIGILSFNYCFDLEKMLLLAFQRVSDTGMLIVIVFSSLSSSETVFSVKDNTFIFGKNYLINVSKRINDNFDVNVTLNECSPCNGRNGMIITCAHKK